MEETKNTTEQSAETKFCKECGQKIAAKAVICPHCGCQVEKAQEAAPQIVINNSNQNQNQNFNANAGFGGNAKNKWVALLLCWFLGFLGAHKFYEGKTFMGIVYLFTAGLFGIGVILDLIAILFKPNPYYV